MVLFPPDNHIALGDCMLVHGVLKTRQPSGTTRPPHVLAQRYLEAAFCHSVWNQVSASTFSMASVLLFQPCFHRDW